MRIEDKKSVSRSRLAGDPACTYSGRVVRRPVLLLLLTLACACVERRLFIRTDPPGARVRVNGTDVGESPTYWPFPHYGAVLVEVDRAGYEAVEQVVELSPPWYQRPVVDFFADVVYPGTVRDDHEVRFLLRPLRRLTEEERDEQMRELTEAARRMRAEVEGNR